MPRKDFQNHLKDAQTGTLPENITSLGPGLDDGTFTVVYHIDSSTDVRIQAQASDVGDYPRSHSFFIYTDSNDVPPTVSSALQDISIISEMTISQSIREIAAKLNYATAVQGQGEDEDMEEDSSGYDDSDNGFCPLEDEYIDGEHDEMCTSGHESVSPPQLRSIQSSSVSTEDRAILSKMIREDINLVKQAGFRISHHGDIFSPGEQCYLMISIRVAKLGIPDDTLRAWHLEQSEYLMLVLKYNQGYRNYYGLKNSSLPRKYLTMNLLVTKRHKLSSHDLSNAIDNTKKAHNENKIAAEVNDTESPTRPLFIGPALNELLNTRLLTLIQYRIGGSLNWNAAVQFYNDQQGALNTAGNNLHAYQLMEDISKIKNLPDLVTADHLRDVISASKSTLSLPCAAMQFVLKHTVRCTEFCLVCFAKVEDEFEALKPYVCSKPLCLYQYMSMGLGPGIEFEVMSQPYVVDLLVSLCYSAIRGFSLRELPIGLGLAVPDPELIPGYSHSIGFNSQNTASRAASTVSTPNTSHKASRDVKVLGKWHQDTKSLILPENHNIERDETMPRRRINAGDWIIFWTVEHRLYHCKIVEVHQATYHYSHLIESRGTVQAKDLTSSSKSNPCLKSLATPSGDVNVQIVPYGRLLDDLGAESMQVALRMMLDTLPTLSEMAEYLRRERGTSSQLIKNAEHIVPAALAILRWIVASNRSCLIYTGDDPREEQIKGMSGHLQFRFASGAPDKESRFLKNVKDTQARLSPTHPTIFAWHGSPIGNWHSIIRDGLDFKKIVNGRSYGDGVYHAQAASVSVAYVHGAPHGTHWPSSELQVQHVLSLNEIVNAPGEFQSAKPYLVVQHIDWIQTRYLFVKCGNTGIAKDKNRTPTEILPQSPSYTPIGLEHESLVIPICAISKSRQKAMIPNKVPSLLKKTEKMDKFDFGMGNQALPLYESDPSDEDDALLFHDLHPALKCVVVQPSQINKGSSQPKNTTDFKSGSLDRSKLPLLAAPSYATTPSTKSLQREIKSMLKEQQQTPLHELGWFLDPEHLDNPYQWIVELHSFDKSLPLAKDMATHKLESIILEIRFGPNFNFSPPFIRVIRPRFLPFLQGGGGHVTAGGALCMELLTSDGWNPSSTMSAVLLQVRMAMTSVDPKPARLDRGSVSDYGVFEAIEAYKRACNTHGWKIPDDFQTLTTMLNAAPSEHHQGGTISGNPIVEQQRIDSLLAFKRQRKA